MNLGLGLIAADQYFKAGDAREIRDRQRRQFEQEDQIKQAELSLLPDRTTAARSGYQVNNANNQISLATVGDRQRTAVANAAAGATTAEGAVRRAPTEVALANNDAQFRLNQQPVIQATTAAQQAFGLGQASGSLARLPDDQETLNNQSLVARDLSRFNVKDLPRVITEKVRAGAISEAQAMPAVHAALADLVAAGDPGEIVRFVNTMSEARGGANAVKIGGVRVEGGNLVFQDGAGQDMAQANGMKMSIPLATLKAAKDRLSKTEFKPVNAGDTLVGVRNGEVVSQYTAPESQRRAAERQGPTERDVNYWVREFGLSKEEAAQRILQGKTMSRRQYILQNLPNAKLMSQGKSDEDIVADLNRQYDAVTKTGGTGAASSSTGAVDPRIGSLIGVTQ